MISLTGWLIELEFGHIVHRWHFTDWYHNFVYIISSSGNDIEVLLWTVTVSSITFRVSEGKFDRLTYKLTTVTNYTRPTRFILRAIDCQKLYRFIVWLSVIYMVYNWQQKVQFSRISYCCFCYCFKYCQRKTPPKILQIHPYCLIVSLKDRDKTFLLQVVFAYLGVCVRDLNIRTFCGVHFRIVYILR